MVSSYHRAREHMVTDQLMSRDIDDVRVLAAMREVPREAFVPKDFEIYAYFDRPLPIGNGQTISQPYIVALMAQALALKGDERVLEIGGGCGYSAAVLGELAAEVESYEIIPELAEKAQKNLEKIGTRNVKTYAGEGTSIDGQDYYDAISVAAAPAVVPNALFRLLKRGGRLVVPVGPQGGAQMLMLFTKDGDGSINEKAICPVAFVPLM